MRLDHALRRPLRLPGRGDGMRAGVDLDGAAAAGSRGGLPDRSLSVFGWRLTAGGVPDGQRDAAEPRQRRRTRRPCR